MTIEIISFDDALRTAPAKRHLLLGNGFSIALKPDIFSYKSLHSKADFSKVAFAAAIFEALGTSDFEAVIRSLMNSAKLLKVYEGVPAALVSQLEHDAAELKNVLVAAIGHNHPSRPFDIEPQRYAACRQFLSNFDHVYTLNYDILLYWALMQDEVDRLDLRSDDGFMHPEEENDETYVSWL
jgi:hypothetical protein